MISIETFSQFKERYLMLKEASRIKSTEDFRMKFDTLRHGYQSAKTLVEERYRKTAKSFNIFSILNMGSYEVRTHTPFLAELLDVKGSHGQGNLFLDRFLQDLLGFPDGEAKDPNWYVILEKDYIDLRLINHFLRKAVFLENKIDTVAHSGQLSRYYKRWDAEFRCCGAFVYLTPTGVEPPESGLDDTLCPRSEMRIQCLSYKGDVANWLGGLLNKIEAQRVRETVTQYIDLIAMQYGS